MIFKTKVPRHFFSLLLCAMALVYVLLIELSHKPLFTCFDHRVGNLVPLDLISVMVVVLFVIAVAWHGRQVEWMTRLDFLWQYTAKNEKYEMDALKNSNERILYNLLPKHVAKYASHRSCCCVISRCVFWNKYMFYE